MSLISPTTLLVTGSINITLSPAAFVWMMRTVPAPCRKPRLHTAITAPNNLVFMTGHSKLSQHVVHPVFAPAGGPRLSDLQSEGRAVAAREASRSRALYHLPFDGDGVPAAAAAERRDEVRRRGIAEELRHGEEVRAAGQREGESAAADAARARSRRNRIPPRRQALGVAGRSRVEGARRLGQWQVVRSGTTCAFATSSATPRKSSSTPATANTPTSA